MAQVAPRSNNRSSTLPRESGNRTYIITASWMILDDALKERNELSALLIRQRYGCFTAPAILA